MKDFLEAPSAHFYHINDYSWDNQTDRHPYYDRVFQHLWQASQWEETLFGSQNAIDCLDDWLSLKDRKACYLLKSLREDPLGALSYFFDQLEVDEPLTIVEVLYQQTLPNTPQNLSSTKREYIQLDAVLLSLITDAGFEIVHQSTFSLPNEDVDQVKAFALYALQLRKVMPKLRIIKMTKQYYDKFNQLFLAAFNESMSLDLYLWKYQRGMGVGVLADDELIAHSGAFVRPLCLHSENHHAQPWAYQIGDSMVHPKKRASFSRRNPFYLVNATQMLLAQTNGFYLAYGFPNNRAYQVGMKLGIYQAVGKLYECEEPLSEDDLNDSLQDNYYRMQAASKIEVIKHKKKVEYFLQQRKENLHGKIHLNLDWAYFQYRFMEHPIYDYSYAFFFRRQWLGVKKNVGMLVYRKVDDVCMIMLVAVNTQNQEMDVYENIMRAFKAYAKQMGIARLKIWGNHEYLERFNLKSKKEAHVTIPCSSLYPHCALESVQDAWHLELMDTDFI